MLKTLPVHVDQSSWPGPGRQPVFPSAFTAGWSDFQLHFPSMLLLIGYLTTPVSSAGVSLSEFWAWVRYLAAVTDESQLRLTRNFANLDSHQKTILSDDFGMGAPMLWLSQQLNLSHICDGRYFIQKIAARIGAIARRTSKRGPSKAPDFVARDATGVWHVVECKGTQSGFDYCNWQLGEPGPPFPTRGVAQKNAIIFPPAYTGQRLVAGLSIGVDGGDEDSQMFVTDPEPAPEEAFDIDVHAMSAADDAATRSVLAKALRLAGFATAAEATAAPWGPQPTSMPSRVARAEQRRREFIIERDARAKEEISRASERRAMSVDGWGFRGRAFEFDLPRPITVNGQTLYRAFVRQGINEAMLGELSTMPTVENLIAEERPVYDEALGQTAVYGNETEATLKIGSLFRAELRLS